MCSESCKRLLAWTLTGCVALSVPAGGSASQAEPTSRDILGVMAEGYLSNREAFPFLQCWFRRVDGKAASPEAAVKGQLQQTIYWEGHWVVNGPKVRYRLECEEKAMQEGKEKSRRAKTPVITLPCNSRGYLTDGTYQMYFGSIGGNVNIYGPGGRANGIDMTPFSMGVMGMNEVLNPGRLLRECVRGRYVGRVEGERTVDGKKLPEVSITFPEDRQRFNYLLDPERGFLPVRLWHTDLQTGARTFIIYVTAIRACSQGRWFPARSVEIQDPDKQQPPYRVRELTVTDLDVDQPPGDDQFFADIPRGAQISDPTEPYVVYRSAQPERVTLATLATVYQRAVAAGQKMRLRDDPDAVLPVDASLFRRLLFFGLNLLVILLVVAWFVFRRRIAVLFSRSG